METPIVNQPFRTALEEIVLEAQRQKDAAEFQLGIAKEFVNYVEAQIKYREGQLKQSTRLYNYITAIYENAIAKQHIEEYK